jgi:hypothetical protein
VNALDSVQSTLADIAKDSSRLLEQRGDKNIIVGHFHGPAAFRAASGPGIEKLLEEELSATGIRVVKTGAPVTIQGRYSFADDGSLRVNVELTNQNGELLNSNFDGDHDVHFRGGKATVTGVDAPGEMATLLGATVDLRNANSIQRNSERNRIAGEGFGQQSEQVRTILSSFQQSFADITQHGSVHTKGGPFYFQVISNSDNQPRPAYLDDNAVPYVSLKDGESFHLHFWNYADYDVSARFYLDGINSFSFSDVRNEVGRPKYQRWIVSSGEMLCLQGWHRNNQEVDEFKVVPYRESAAGRLGRSRDVGTITVEVRRTYIAKIKAAMGAPAPLDPPRGIGFGRREQMPVIPDTEKRMYGETEAVITIRYEKP